jgi:DNA-binding PadR family transcriptional regulator|tara:strand:- start:5578 stop:6093 length:516 start_codon:yes stop_codon:yes gene_type:complete
MDEENKETVVLGVISRGISKFDKISRESNVSPKDLESILKKLENSGLIKVDEKKGWLGTKIEINPTENGYKEFERQLKILQEKWNQLENTYKSGNKQELEQKLKEDKSFLPSMMMFGIIDMMMFSMMFSMIGSTVGSFIPADDMGGTDNNVEDMEGTDMGDDDGFDIDIGF